MENIIVDARGEQCPIPVVKAKKALGGMKEAGIVEVHVDNEIAVQNVARLASNMGFKASSEKLAENHFVTKIKASVSSEKEEKEPEVSCTPDRKGNTVVAVDTDVMGRGNDELGKTLMKGFIYALTQLEELPNTILFYNSGVMLSTQGSVCLEDLKNMEAQGVKIMSCGTCLNFFGLTEKLAVGDIANMYSIVETLNGAAKIIKP
jgi:selenium metabolism protein YedF